uniref:Guanine nucleotide-binding protein-like 3 N-terminal domain-containing protein n=1 Tax=Globodera rostochiensis TaxID=31243 RepID=A0A914I9K2_GLORO
MAKYCLKKPSKRLTCKKKFKIQRKVREHSRKLRKLSKESERKKKSDKPVSVPNKCPFKEELLMEAEQKRAELKTLETERKARQKSAKTNGKKVQQTKRKAKTDDASIEALAKRANNDEDDYNANRVLAEMLPEKTNNADADMLDARDPFGSRSDQIEKLVIESGKRLMLLLNKIDLVPRENLLKWLAHLRQQLPTIAFKASTQEQNQKLVGFSKCGQIQCDQQFEAAEVLPDGCLAGVDEVFDASDPFGSRSDTFNSLPPSSDKESAKPRLFL